MSGYSNGVDRFFLIDTRSRGLDITCSSRGRLDLIEHLIRCEMLDADTAEAKAKIRAVVEFALKHMDDEVSHG